MPGRLRLDWHPFIHSTSPNLSKIVLHACLWTVVVVILLAGQIPGWLAYRDGSTIIFAYTQQPFPLVTHEVHAGEALGLYVSRCNYTSEMVRYIITRTLARPPASGDESQPWVSARVLEPIPVDVPPGCATTLSNAHVIPKDIPPGLYRLQLLALATYHGKSYSDSANSEPFTVLP